MAGPPRRPGLARQDSPAKPAAFTAVALLLLHAFSAAAAIYMRRYAGEYSATQAQWSFAVAAAIGGVAAWVGPPLPPAAAPLVWLATAAGLMDSRRHLSLAFERILADGPRGASISSQELMLRSAAAAFSGGALACTMLGWLSATSARAVIIKGRHPFKPVGMMLLSFLAASPIVRIPMPIPTPTCLAPMITAFISTAASVLSFPARPQRSAFHARWMALALLGGVIVKQGLRCMQCDPVPPGPAATHASMLGATELWSCELRRGGVVSVVEGPSPGSKELGLRYRLMRLDHSIMGGTWIAPHEAAGSSVYSAFVLQSAARLFVRRRDRNESDGKVPAPRLNSLVVGLGAGTVVDALRRHGFSTSVVELHEEIYSAASSFNFTATPLESVEIGDGALALAAARPKPYDIVIVDVFSGGAVPSTLESPQFFEHVKRLVVSHHQPPGVLALNWYGPTASEALRCLLCRLRRVFQGVRVFADVEDAAVKNHVVFASDDSEFAALDVADIVAAEKQRLLEAGKILDAQEAEILNKLDKMEIEVIRPGLKACSELEHGDGRRCAGARAAAGKEAAVAHWRAMRGQFGDAFWHL